MIHSSVWLGRDLRDHEKLSEGDLALLHGRLHHFVQLPDVFGFTDWQHHIGHFAGIHDNLFIFFFVYNTKFDWTSIMVLLQYSHRTLPTFWVWAVFCSFAESTVSNEVKDFQPVHHGCKSAADHVIFSLACSESSSLKGSYWGEDFTWALSALCTVVAKLPVGSMRLYFVAGPRLMCGTIGLWL